MKPLISVIMPTYNAEAYVAQAVSSVLNQTYRTLELVIIDDASTDATFRRLRPFLADPRVRYVHLAQRVSVARVRNRALALATGQYVAFLDADDEWLPNKLACQLRFMTREQVSFSYGYYDVIDSEDRILSRHNRVPLAVDYHCLLKTNAIPLLTVMIHRQVLRGHPFPDRPDEDYALWLSLLRSGGVAYGLPIVLGRYRNHVHSISQNKWRASRWVWQLYRQQEHLPWLLAAWDWNCYVWNGLIKHRPRLKNVQ